MNKIRLKLIIALLFLFVIVLAGLFSFLKGQITTRIREQALEVLEKTVDQIPGDFSGNTREKLEKSGFRVTVMNLSGRVDYDTYSQGISESYLYRDEVKYGHTVRYEPALGKEFLYVVKKLNQRMIRLGLEDRKDFYADLTQKFVYYALFGVVILVLVALLVIESIFGPIKDILRFTRRFGEGEYQARINYFGGGDIGLISNNLNKMARTIENNYLELKKRQDLIESVILNFPLGIALLDERGRVEIHNPKLEIMLNAQILSNRLYYETFFNSKIVETIKQCYDSRRDVLIKLPILTMDVKSIYDFNCHYVNGKVIAVASDMTEQEKLNRLKEQFISDVTHEFKTPISIIMGYLEILEDRMSGQQERYYFDKVKTALNRLVEIINDLVRLEKIEYANLFGDFQEVNLSQIVDRAVELLAPAAERKKVELSVLPHASDLSLRGVEEILYYCVYNLMDNAIKYHDKPSGAQVSVKIVESDQKIILSIFDNGPGIPLQYREDIFRRFYRLSKGRSSQNGNGGSGLGLSIVREGVKFHHGTVICKDNPEGEGVCFEMTFPKAG